MKNDIVIVRGYDFDASKGILHTAYEVSKKTDKKISDQDFSTLLAHFNKDGEDEMVFEDKIIELMLDSEEYKFTRIKDGFSIYRY